MRPSSSNKYLSPVLEAEKKGSFREHSFSKHFEILLHEHNDDAMPNNNDKNKQYYDNFLLALKSESNEVNKQKKNPRKVNRKSVQLDFSSISLMKLKNIKPDKRSSPSNFHSKKPAINNINIYITKNKEEKPCSVYSSVKSSEDETKKLMVKKKNVYYSNFNSKNTNNTEKKNDTPNEVKKKKKFLCCIPIG